MEQQELFPLSSPCIGVCESNNRGYCKGCLRNRDERLYWLQMNNLQKHHIIRLCQARRRKLEQLALKDNKKHIFLPEQMDFPF